jgi:iron complex transport system substrate-binding protein
MRICSLLPSSTEIAFALGLGDSICGVSHECDFPPEARTRRVVVHSRLPQGASSAEIDRLVSEFTARGESIYSVDTDALRELDPDLILTQELCHVCAASPDDLAAALSVLPRTPQILSLNPHSLADVWNDVRAVGAATGRAAEAESLVRDRIERIESVTQAVEPAVRDAGRPRVVCLEWLDPPYSAGHWVPKMVLLAGGTDVLGRIGEPSVRVDWQQVADAKPEVILISPCGFNCEQAAAEFARLQLPSMWQDLPAVRAGRVFAADANSYLSRPGPRLAEGIAVLARAIHPEVRVAIPEASLRALGSSRVHAA